MRETPQHRNSPTRSVSLRVYCREAAATPPRAHRGSFTNAGPPGSGETAVPESRARAGAGTGPGPGRESGAIASSPAYGEPPLPGKRAVTNSRARRPGAAWTSLARRCARVRRSSRALGAGPRARQAQASGAARRGGVTGPGRASPWRRRCRPPGAPRQPPTNRAQ